MQEEDDRADGQAKTLTVVNESAPRLVRRKSAPKRMQKPLFMQQKHVRGFEKLVFKEKQDGGKKAPELAEEAIELLLEKYGIKL